LKDDWDGENLKFTLRRTVDRRTLEQWHELIQIASNIQFSNDMDAIIWEFDSNGRYSVQSLYAIVNFRGVKHVYTPVIWKIHVPTSFCNCWLITKL
jgi:hypothetical protein